MKSDIFTLKRQTSNVAKILGRPKMPVHLNLHTVQCMAIDTLYSNDKEITERK